ncbi:hypothetical protein KBC13_01590 [Candidatus Shapirobacteria bacterium]|jgi:hypothetical protein|nr:hypothetical protein [Candidatus Shapirobacteria bacterium]
MTEKEANKIFIKKIKEFKNQDITLDEFSSFSGRFFHEAGKKYPKSDLFQATLMASELNFAVRAPAVFDNISMYLEEVENFYKKYSKE